LAAIFSFKNNNISAIFRHVQFQTFSAIYFLFFSFKLSDVSISMHFLVLGCFVYLTVKNNLQ